MFPCGISELKQSSVTEPHRRERRGRTERGRGRPAARTAGLDARRRPHRAKGGRWEEGPKAGLTVDAPWQSELDAVGCRRRSRRPRDEEEGDAVVEALAALRPARGCADGEGNAAVPFPQQAQPGDDRGGGATSVPDGDNGGDRRAPGKKRSTARGLWRLPGPVEEAGAQRGHPRFRSRRDHGLTTTTATAPSPQTSGHGGVWRVQRRNSENFLGGRNTEEEGGKGRSGGAGGREGKWSGWDLGFRGGGC